MSLMCFPFGVNLCCRIFLRVVINKSSTGRLRPIGVVSLFGECTRVRDLHKRMSILPTVYPNYHARSSIGVLSLEYPEGYHID